MNDTNHGYSAMIYWRTVISEAHEKGWFVSTGIHMNAGDPGLSDSVEIKQLVVFAMFTVVALGQELKVHGSDDWWLDMMNTA